MCGISEVASVYGISLRFTSAFHLLPFPLINYALRFISIKGEMMSSRVLKANLIRRDKLFLSQTFHSGVVALIRIEKFSPLLRLEAKLISQHNLCKRMHLPVFHHVKASMEIMQGNLREMCNSDGGES